MRRTGSPLQFALRTILLFVAIIGGISAPLPASDLRDRSFDSDGRFLRTDAPGAQEPEFDDSKWRKIDLPHDWSIEDLPPIENSLPQIDAVTGDWLFHRGDDAKWKARDLDDSDWDKVKLPEYWERHSKYDDVNAYGWFRRYIQIPPGLTKSDFVLLLGRIDDVDEVWLNGERIGGTGSFPPVYRTAWSEERRYPVPASLVRGDGKDVIAARVFDGEGDGGLYAAGQETSRVGPFDPANSENADKTGYILGGVGWYRKHFASPESDEHVAVRFDGVYMIADVWINGHHLGVHPHGYTSFEFELTPFLRPAGEENVLAVRVRNEGKNSRWYSGSGIYRHVWLTTRNPIHVPTWGVFVTTPRVTREKALVKVAVELRNATDSQVHAIVRTWVRDPTGDVIGKTEGKVHLTPKETRTVELFVDVYSPKLWSLDSPELYTTGVEVLVDGRIVDGVSSTFGIRTIEVDADHGFQLNGSPLLLKGGCVHHDNGPLGAAAIDRAEERRVELMKANGFNAVRSSHNPPSPAFLDACDRLGMLVIDEAFDVWNQNKLDNKEDYSRFFKDWHERDLASIVRRDRSHPSVVMWSIGNEIPEQFNAEQTQKRLREMVLSHDPTRPITQAISTDWGRVIRRWDQLSDPAFTHLDVAGYNYLPEKYETDHVRHPERVILGTESFPKDAFKYWALVEKHPFVIGDFVWTSMDYLGESGLAHTVLSSEPNPFFMSWPWHNAWCGDLDICGFKKPQSFYRDVVWRRSPIEMFVHSPIPEGLTEVLSSWAWPDESHCWNWPGHEGERLQVSVYSRCERVRLVLNGKVLGERPVSAESELTARFNVPYEPGELRASGLTDGMVVGESVLRTSGPPCKLELTADRNYIRADRNDLAYVTVEVVDALGRRVPDAEVLVRFSVDGPGELAAQASATPNEPASFRMPQRKTYQGRCLAVIRPTGDPGRIKLHGESNGLAPAIITVTAD